jgi:hypothetical protein
MTRIPTADASVMPPSSSGDGVTLGPPVSGALWIVSLAAIAAGFVIATNATTVYVTVPLAAGLLCALAFLSVLWRRESRRIPWFEIGAVYVAVVALYLAYPLVGFLALHGVYTPQNDRRLTDLAPAAPEAGRIAWLYVSHLASFAVAYLAVRGRVPRIGPPSSWQGRAVLLAAVVACLMINAFQLALARIYDVPSGSYAASYLAMRRMPLLVAQLSNHVGGMKFPLSVALMAMLFTRYQAARPVIVAWLLIALGLSVAHLGSRAEVVLLLLSAAMLYHTLFRPLSLRVVAAFAAGGLVGFVAFGALRGQASGTPIVGFNPFAIATEFETLFANAIHLARVKATIGPVPVAFLFADLSALVPQQVSPLTKIDPAAWYVSTFFPIYAATGGGLAFGTIAEAVLTGGLPSALLRGAALGACFAGVHRFYARHPGSFWVLVFYVWLTTLTYQAFRNTTFSFLVLFVYRFVPAVVMVTLLARIFRWLWRVRAVRAPAAGAARP